MQGQWSEDSVIMLA